MRSKYGVYLILFIVLACTNSNERRKAEIIRQIEVLKQQKSKLSIAELDSTLRNIAYQSHEINYQDGVIEVSKEMANLFFDNGKYDSAIQYNMNALEVRKSKKDTAGIVNSYINIANCYASLKQAKNQKYYLDLLMPLIPRSSDTVNHIRFYTSLGIYYYAVHNYNNSKQVLRKAIQLSKIKKSDEYLSIALLSYGNILIDEECDSAVLYFKNCEQLFTKNNNFKALVSVYNNLAEAYWISKEPKLVIESLNKGYALLAQHGSPTDWQNILFNLAYYHKENGNYQKSIAYYQELDSIKSVFFTESMSKSISNIENDYVLRMKSQENARLAIELKRKNTVRNASVLIAILLTLIGLYQYNNYKQKRKILIAEKELKDQEINQIMKEREVQNLESILQGRVAEQRRIGRDLHDRLGSILSTIKMYFSAIEERLFDLKGEYKMQYEKALNLLDEAVSEVRRISHDLSCGVLVKYGLIAAIQELKKTIESSGKLEINLFNAGEYKSPNLEFEITLYRIIQELMSNILKHSEAKKIDIHLTQQANLITLLVEDNGKGFDVNNVSKSGIGLANIQQRVASLGGVVNIDSSIGKGCSVIIEISLNE